MISRFGSVIVGLGLLVGIGAPARAQSLAEPESDGGDTRAVVKLDSRMGRTVELRDAAFALDGHPILRGGPQIFAGSVGPGAHVLTVVLVYRGRRRGIFTYPHGYKYTVSATHVFEALRGKTTLLTVRAHRKGSFADPERNRMAIDFEVTTMIPAGPAPMAALR